MRQEARKLDVYKEGDITMKNCEICNKPSLPGLNVCELCYKRQIDAISEAKNPPKPKPDNIIKFPDKEKKDEQEKFAVELGTGSPQPQNIANAMKVANELGLANKSIVHFAFENQGEKIAVIVTLEQYSAAPSPSSPSSLPSPDSESVSKPDPLPVSEDHPTPENG